MSISQISALVSSERDLQPLGLWVVETLSDHIAWESR